MSDPRVKKIVMGATDDGFEYATVPGREAQPAPSTCPSCTHPHKRGVRCTASTGLMMTCNCKWPITDYVEAQPVAETPADNRCTYCGRPTETKMWLHPDCMNRYNLSERELLRAEAARASGVPTRVQALEAALRSVNHLQHSMAIELDAIPQQPRIEYWTRQMEAVICEALAARASGAPTRKEWLFDVARKLEADSELALDLVITRDKLATASPEAAPMAKMARDLRDIAKAIEAGWDSSNWGRPLCVRITEYLESGGLFNPEMAIHNGVRDLLIDCREALAAASPAGEGQK